MEPLQWDDRSARCASLLVWFSAWLATSALALEGVASDADVEGPAQVAYAPEGKTGPVVVLISGQSGIEPYKPYAEDLAKLGYYAVLLTGKDILNPQLTGEDNLKRAIERALRSPQAKPGKAAVIGFSLGGGGALYNAAPLAELVSVVVVYYPYTKSWVNKINWFANRFQAPILALAAQRDRYMDCCLAETARAIEAAARKNGKSFELVVYPDADHGFNLRWGAKREINPAYRGDDDRDAWQRTGEMLERYQPLPRGGMGQGLPIMR